MINDYGNITPKNIQAAIRYYSHIQRVAPTKDSPHRISKGKLKGKSWSDVDDALANNLIQGEKAKSLAEFISTHGMHIKPGSKRTASKIKLTAAGIVETLLLSIERNRTRPRISDSTDVELGPYAKKTSWKNISEQARSDYQKEVLSDIQIPGEVYVIQYILKIVFDVLEIKGADFGKDKGINRGNGLIRLPENFDTLKADIINLVLQKLARPDFQLPSKPEKAVTISARDLFRTLATLNTDEVCALVDTPSREINLGGEFISVAVVNAAFANRTVSGIDTCINADPTTLSSFRDFAIACTYYPEDAPKSLDRAKQRQESIEETNRDEQEPMLSPAAVNSFG